jgi:hypothetical protein
MPRGSPIDGANTMETVTCPFTAAASRPSRSNRSRSTEHDDCLYLSHQQVSDAPVACSRDQRAQHGHIGAGDGLVDADRLCERQPEYTEAVRHADAKMNRECGWRHQPAIESRFSNDARAREKAWSSLPDANSRGRHFRFPHPQSLRRRRQGPVQVPRAAWQGRLAVVTKSPCRCHIAHETLELKYGCQDLRLGRNRRDSCRYTPSRLINWAHASAMSAVAISATRSPWLSDISETMTKPVIGARTTPVK